MIQLNHTTNAIFMPDETVVSFPELKIHKEILTL